MVFSQYKLPTTLRIVLLKILLKRHNEINCAGSSREKKHFNPIFYLHIPAQRFCLGLGIKKQPLFHWHSVQHYFRPLLMQISSFKSEEGEPRRMNLKHSPFVQKNNISHLYLVRMVLNRNKKQNVNCLLFLHKQSFETGGTEHKVYA